jgi:AGCS family alanine or glycine:cation symporter
MILFTNKYNVVNPSGGFIIENLPGTAIGAEFTQQAVNTYFPSVGASFVAISLLFFAFTTIMAYYYIAETNLSYLNRKGNKSLIWLLRGLILVASFYGAVKTAQSAWALGDIGVGIMAWLNIIAILLLRKPALLALRDYQAQRKAGLDPVFNAGKVGIPGTEEWNQTRPVEKPVQVG